MNVGANGQQFNFCPVTPSNQRLSLLLIKFSSPPATMIVMPFPGISFLLNEFEMGDFVSLRKEENRRAIALGSSQFPDSRRATVARSTTNVNKQLTSSGKPTAGTAT
jgi:hypothetical protein